MKKIAFTGFMASVLMATGAMAAPGDATPLTTKNYVDSGLRAVYNASQSGISTNAGNITTLQSTVGEHGTAINQHAELINGLSTTVGNAESGLVADVAELQSQISTLNGVEGLGTKADQSALESEITRATTAEAANATAISTEAARAAAAEQANASAISAETTRATGVESGLNTRLTTAEGEIDALQTAVNSLDGVAYTGTNGVTVDNHQVALDVTAETGKMYVYTSNGWNEIPVEDTWDDSILTPGAGFGESMGSGGGVGGN